MTALQKGSYCFWDTYGLQLSLSLGMYLSCAKGCQAHLAGPHVPANRRHSAPASPSHHKSKNS